MIKVRKIINILSIITALLIITISAISKGSYYMSKYNNGYFSSTGVAIAWISIGMLVILAPLSIFVIGSFIDNFVQNNKIYIVTTSISFGGIIINVIIEILSLMGAGMCNDRQWGDMALKMIYFSIYSIIPLIMGVISIVIKGKINKQDIKK